jgi:hypothetical protein
LGIRWDSLELIASKVIESPVRHFLDFVVGH